MLRKDLQAAKHNKVDFWRKKVIFDFNQGYMNRMDSLSTEI